LQKITFHNEEKIYFENNNEKSYVRECQIKEFLHNVESLQTYFIQYANQNLFENEKQTQLFQMFVEKFPCLDSYMNNGKTMFTCETHVNENTSNIVKYIQHKFEDEIQNFVFNHDQLKIVDILINETKGLCVLEGILGSGKKIIVKYLTHYIQTQSKNVF